MIANSLVDPKEFQPKAEAAAQKALQLDGGLAEAHLALAGIRTDQWDWAGAEEEYKRAIELKPNMGPAHRGFSSYLGNVGRHDEAVAEAKTARELDPLTLGTNITVSLSLIHARRFDDAIESSQVVMKEAKHWGNLILGYAHAGKGLFKEAAAYYEESIKAGNPSPSVQIYLGAAYARAGEPEKAQAIIKTLKSSKSYVSPAELAVLYAGMGDKDAAFRSLEKGFAEHDAQLKYLKSDSGFDALRSDPRFLDLMKRVGLPL